jgi:hypothetical protein
MQDRRDKKVSITLSKLQRSVENKLAALREKYVFLAILASARYLSVQSATP